MIPKVIHYCWFGGSEKPADIKRYIKTWKRYMPDYKIIEWNEKNFSIPDACAYVRQAYQNKKWAFVSDYVRLHALYHYGGVYLDTDVQVFRSFNVFLKHSVVFGFESGDSVATSVMLSVPEHSFIKQFMDSYHKVHFVKKDGSLRTDVINVKILTKMLCRRGLVLNGRMQNIDGMAVYPQKYFSPNNFINIVGLYKKENYAYHHANASWTESVPLKGIAHRGKRYLVGILRNSIGTDKLAELRKWMFEKSPFMLDILFWMNGYRNH